MFNCDLTTSAVILQSCKFYHVFKNRVKTLSLVQISCKIAVLGYTHFLSQLLQNDKNFVTRYNDKYSDHYSPNQSLRFVIPHCVVE